jgi:hypothetical protein
MKDIHNKLKISHIVIGRLVDVGTTMAKAANDRFRMTHDLPIFSTCLPTLTLHMRGDNANGPGWEPAPRHRSSTASPDTDSLAVNVSGGYLCSSRTSGGQARLSDKQWRKIFEILGRPTIANVAVTGCLRLSVSPADQKSIQTSLFWRRARQGWRLQSLVIGFLVVATVAVGQQAFEFGRAKFQSAQATVRGSQAQEFTVTDGDTVHVIGEAAGTRLVGFNTPEKFSPENERQLGKRASLRLRELVVSRNVRLTKVACACPAGTAGTSKCNHGRSCGALQADGEHSEKF